MNRIKAEKLLPIIKAYAEGKTIQYYSRLKSTPSWEDCEDEDIDFEDETKDYRIKPESKYIPFTNIEECWAEMEKHKPFGWLKQKDFRINIANVMSKAITFADNEGRNFSFETIFKEYTFVDGIPFGVKKE